MGTKGPHETSEVKGEGERTCSRHRGRQIHCAPEPARPSSPGLSGNRRRRRRHREQHRRGEKPSPPSGTQGNLRALSQSRLPKPTTQLPRVHILGPGSKAWMPLSISFRVIKNAFFLFVLGRLGGHTAPGSPGSPLLRSPPRAEVLRARTVESEKETGDPGPRSRGVDAAGAFPSPTPRPDFHDAFRTILELHVKPKEGPRLL